ncbi:TIGR02453 family protein [Aeromicrobium yanjiei]|uniref:TIGR02453 family protein n=2 Tax=Aeromicrobium yanjiei TaxID=2662028 RepID=A0A5Q2MJK2_9ACTN|nr:TIGR02453 family protein [Aeromicrobium yanjiei]
MDNTKTFWEAHKEVYATAVAAPMRALVAALADEFGEARIYRPYRDVRFAKDKTPYKTHQGAFVAKGPSTGYYVQVGAPGVRVGSGFYEASPARLASIREAIVDDRRGRELEEILAALRSSGWEIGGNRLKTSPRGYDADHPRIDLLRHKSMNVGKSYGFEPVIHTPELVDRVRADWREVTPLVEWFLRYARG